MGPRKNTRRQISPQSAAQILGYIRVSTSKQAEEGVSLETQQEKLKAYAALYDLQLAEIIVDAGGSAKSLDRPGLQRALAMLRAGEANGLLVAKLDRLTRSVKDLGFLLEDLFGRSDGPALLSVGEQFDTRTAAGRMVMNILVVIAQWERETIGERTSAAMQQMRADGVYTGGKVRFGFRVDDQGKLQADEIEQAIIAFARRLQVEGKSLRSVSRALADRGLLSRSGRPFNPSAVMKMLSEAA